MKFECKVCIESCLLDMGDSAVIPEECPIGCEAVDWHKVTEPVALPKLTVEELEKRGIEWPEWAVYAGVHAFGRLMFFEQRPRLNTSIGGWDYYGFDPIPKMSDENAYFEYVDWQNSLIIRLKKFYDPQLPDWVKVGAWAAVGKFVGKIDWINRDASECRITCGESRFAKTGEVKAVTWRAWTRSEWCEQIGNRFQFNDGVRMLLSAIGRDGKFEVEFLGGSYCENDDILNENITQLSGLPCGVPQVDGKDLEG